VTAEAVAELVTRGALPEIAQPFTRARFDRREPTRASA